MEELAIRNAQGYFDQNCVGGNGAVGGYGGSTAGGGGGAGWLNSDKDITLVNTNDGKMGDGTDSTKDSKIVIRLAT